MWLRDFLPTKIPDSRILIYGYRANVFGGTMGRIRAFAENFLEDLRTQRLLVAVSIHCSMLERKANLVL